MKASEILERFKVFEEQILLTPEKVKQIFDAALIDYELEEDEKITEYTYETMYNNYKYYLLTYASQYIMLAGDFNSLKTDLANELAQCLPDDFDKFFDSKLLRQEMDKDEYYLNQTIRTINKIKQDDKYLLHVLDTVTVDNIDYVILEEIIDDKD